MQLRFLGKDSTPTNSPTLYATDHGVYVVQGWIVTDPEILTKLDIPQDETIVEIPPRLLTHLAKDGLAGTVTSWRPPIVHVTAHGNYIIQGKRVVAADTLGQMNIPDHEDCVEVSRSALESLLDER